MSPTRRDILKASAGAVTAALAGVAITPAAAEESTSLSQVNRWDPPLGEIRKASMLGMISNPDAPRSSMSEFYFDGDLDGTWTLIITPYWLRSALVGERDVEGIYSCSDYTSSQLMEIMWSMGQQQRPLVLSALPLQDTEGLFESLPKSRYWVDIARYRRGEVSVDQLNDDENHPWEFVVWNHPLLEQYPGANAIIECRGHFYKAIVDKEPVNCACCAE